MDKTNKNISIIRNIQGEQIVFINDIQFKGRQKIAWNDVETYLKKWSGKHIKIIETEDIIYIGKDFADEYTGSKYTARLMGTLAKAKANAVQGLPKIIQIAKNKRMQKNLAEKHKFNAKYGWYRFDTRFALPILSENGTILRYNIFCAELVIRHSADNKMYLYDMINLKKETGTPLEL